MSTRPKATRDEDIAAEQQKLNALYDSFTAKYGLLNSRGNKLAFSEDSSYCLLCSLEVLDEQGNLKRKADMFTPAHHPAPCGCHQCGYSQ